LAARPGLHTAPARRALVVSARQRVRVIPGLVGIVVGAGEALSGAREGCLGEGGERALERRDRVARVLEALLEVEVEGAREPRVDRRREARVVARGRGEAAPH